MSIVRSRCSGSSPASHCLSVRSKLDAMSPLKVLSRGYSMTFGAQGHVVRSVRTLSCGDRITVRLADGRASAEVREIQEDAT